jgi:hypothetical protein
MRRGYSGGKNWHHQFLRGKRWFLERGVGGKGSIVGSGGGGGGGRIFVICNSAGKGRGKESYAVIALQNKNKMREIDAIVSRCNCFTMQLKVE